MTDRYAVIGNPVAHSKSPRIHAEFARQTGQDMSYQKLLAPLDGFKQIIMRFRDEGGKGANVTLPFKVEAFRLCVPRAHAIDADAVNTLRFVGAAIEGYNTDGVGLVRDLEINLGVVLAGKRVLLMGAGGAARGVLIPLLEQGPAALVLCNRTLDKAAELGRLVLERRSAITSLSWHGYASLEGGEFDVVINATSASLAGQVPPLPRGVFAPACIAYDMVYARELTPFLRFAQAQGVERLADGIGMLVEQAAESFLLWRGVRPKTAPVIDKLRREA